MDQRHLELLAQIASWYYQDNLGQAEIARRIDRSRSMVSRLLTEAREIGLVKIHICYPVIRTATELEQRLCDAFSLSQAAVLVDPPSDFPLLIRRLGELGAQVFRQRLQGKSKIGIMWGTTIYEVVWAMPTLSLADTTVIQMIGTVGRGNHLMDGPELARSLAEKLSASYRYLPAPIIVEDEAVAQSLRQQPAIAEVLDEASQVDIALLGIGTRDDYFSYLEATGYVKDSDLAELEQAGAVGSILGVFFGTDGQPLDISINRRVIGFQDMAALHGIPTVMAVAGGVKKAEAIRAVLCRGYIDILVTDAVTAATVLNSGPERAHV